MDDPPGRLSLQRQRQAGEIARLNQRIAELEAALRWLVNLAHDTGKGGGRPEPGEWEAAFKSGETALRIE
jgi:hypothetical protein